MSRRPDSSKQQELEERFQRYEELSQTIANFCQTVGVSEPSFYYWKQKLPGGRRQGRRANNARKTPKG